MWLGSFGNGNLQKWSLGVELIVKNPQWARLSEIKLVICVIKIVFLSNEK
jgi:hypothetical protein